MNFAPNKTPIEIIKEGAFGGTYFRDMYSSINGKWYRNSWKEFDFLCDIDPKLYLSNYYDTNVNKFKIKCGTSLRFWENKGWNNMVNRFKGVIVKMIKSRNAKYNDYSISPKIRQILLHWGYELVESDCF